MKKIFFALTCVFLAVQAAGAQENERRYALYGVAFYNLENLFDTIHDAGKNDYEYLPDGTNRWNTLKYRSKLRNMALVLSQLCRDKLPTGPAFVGVSEIENRRVLEDLLREPALEKSGWQIVHEEGPDRRGVECAFFYNPRLFKYESHQLVPYYYLDPEQPDVNMGFYTNTAGRVVAHRELRGDTTHITRGFLVMSGTLAGEKTHAIVCHWPSRFAGSPVRERAGEQVRALKDALLRQDPGCNVIIMGDMNDDPKDRSMSEALGCKHRQQDVTSEADLFNPWWDTLYRVGQGTLLYDGKWNLFDQIVFTGGLLNDKTAKNLQYFKHEVFVRDYLIQQEGRYKGSPKRTQASGTWIDGYSDHLPTTVYFKKQVK